MKPELSLTSSVSVKFCYFASKDALSLCVDRVLSSNNSCREGVLFITPWNNVCVDDVPVPTHSSDEDSTSATDVLH